MEERLLSASESPIVILSRRNDSLAPSIAPRNPYLGVMLPYTPLHHILMKQLKMPLVATSGNVSDEPICIDEVEALTRLDGVADLFLVHNRPIRRHVDDSIVRVMLGREQILRRARGYAPLPIAVKRPLPDTLSVGAHLKNAIALSVGSHVFLSQHIGDLDKHEALSAFRSVIDDFERMFEVRRDRIVCDLHPDYASTHYAEPAPIRVQHHCAHVASCMADNDLEPPALGVAWDGGGYGADGTVWGGEFLLAEAGGFRRVAHFRTFPLPGGDAAAKKPQHTAIGLLYEMLGAAAFDGTEPPLLKQALIKQVRTPRTSSAGRLFDAVSSIVGIRGTISFEGQAAMELEFAVQPGVTKSYRYEVCARSEEPALVIDWEPMFRDVLDDVHNGIAIGLIAAKFHNTLAEIVVDIARRIAEPRVVLTGGCFQNRYLTERTVHLLSDAGFRPYWHQRVPPNDGGIALGQTIISATAETRKEPSCVWQSQAR
jgi:hydrogenase maturation protein HypF